MKNNHLFLVLLLCFSLGINLSLGGDTISVNESVSSGQTIVSSGGKFELGFFRPGNPDSYYIGIWYNKVYPQAVVWVANRDKPLDSADAKLIISQGNLVLLDRFQNSIWSALAGNISPNISVTAVLRDDGNLVLSDMSSSSTPLLLWQSFDHPTHIFLPGTKLGYDKRTQRKQVLTSWKDVSDPAPGPYSVEIDPKHAKFVIKWNRTTEYWSSGSLNGRTLSLVPEMRTNFIHNFSYIDNEIESYFTYSLYDSTIISMFILGVSGRFTQAAWLNGSVSWNLLWSAPREFCNVYAYCGAFGVYDEANVTCNCLSGFKPRSDMGWNSNDHSGGCIRDQKVQCNAITETKIVYG